MKEKVQHNNKKIILLITPIILSIITAVIGYLSGELLYGVLLAFFVWIVSIMVELIYFRLPEGISFIRGDIEKLKSLIHKDVVKSIDNEEKVYEKLLDVVNSAQEGDIIYVTTDVAPWKDSSEPKPERFYKLHEPDELPNKDKHKQHKQWEYFKALHERVFSEEIKLRRLALLLPENKESIQGLSKWFESHLKEKRQISEESYKLMYTLNSYYRRILYLEPKDPNKSPICILGMIDSFPINPHANYILYIQSEELRHTIKKEIDFLFGKGSKEYKGEDLWVVFMDKTKG